MLRSFRDTFQYNLKQASTRLSIRSGFAAARDDALRVTQPALPWRRRLDDRQGIGPVIISRQQFWKVLLWETSGGLDLTRSNLRKIDQLNKSRKRDNGGRNGNSGNSVRRAEQRKTFPGPWARYCEHYDQSESAEEVADYAENV